MSGEAGEVNEYFNSQPHKEADSDCVIYSIITEHFNSQPHKEADAEQIDTHPRYTISTHSLTRRLTELDEGYDTIVTFQLTASQGG